MRSVKTTCNLAIFALLAVCLGCVARPPGVQQNGFFEAHVYFATDRRAEHGDKVRFTGMRGDGQLTYGTVKVSIPDSHQVGNIESPEWWQFWDRESPSEFVVLLGVETFEDRARFVRAVNALVADAGRQDVLLFVHGYKTHFEDAARRTAQLAYDLRFPGVPMFYSWPSLDEVDGYPADEESMKWTLPHFQDFLRLVLTDLGARRVHVVAHSMGNRAMIRSLSALDPSTLPPGSAELRQIVLAAPDIDVDVYRQLAADFAGKAERVTLYTSRNDKAILVSKEFHRYPRAGGSLVVLDGVDTVDASNVETDFLGHSYFGDSIVSDIFDTIINEIPPARRFGLVPKSSPDGVYWEFLPGVN